MNQANTRTGTQVDTQTEVRTGTQVDTQTEVRTGTQGTFSFEGLDVYQAAMEGLRGVMALVGGGKLPAELGAQLKRAAIRVVANIAEGAGRGGVADRRRVWLIARGEANECGALIEIAQAIGALGPEQHVRLRSCYLRCVCMLTAMSRG